MNRHHGSERGCGDDTLIFVAQEHCDGIVQKFFTTLADYDDEMTAVYGPDYYTNIEEWDGFETLHEALHARGWAVFDTEYRGIYVRALTFETDVSGLLTLETGSRAYRCEIQHYLDDYHEYVRTGDMEGLDWIDFMDCTDRDLAERGYDPEEISVARAAMDRGDIGIFVHYYKQAWDSERVPSEIYPRLDAMGIPRRYWHPDYRPCPTDEI